MGPDESAATRENPRAFAPVSLDNTHEGSETRGSDAIAAVDRRSSRDLEAQLVEAARGGDRDAFGDLFRMHHAAVYRLARVSLPGAAADDVVGETFLRAWTTLGSYEGKGAFVSWLCGIARYVVIDTHRARTRTQPSEDVEGPTDDPWTGYDRGLDLVDAVGELPDEQRAVIELKYFGGLTNDEVGAVLGKTAGAVNTQQWRAIQRLRARLETS